jgi:cystathionine beta-lyase/cystathionine gamma-synthase
MFDELIDDLVSTRDHAPGLPGLGIDEGLVCLSVGFESIDDLLAELKDARS